MKLVINLLSSVEIIVFLITILHAGFTKDKRRLAAGIIITLCADIFYTYCPDKNAAMIFGNLFGNMVSAIVLLDEGVLNNLFKYYFASVYVSFLYSPFELVIFIIKSLLKININEDVENLVMCVAVISLMCIIYKILGRYKELISWIREIPAVYYVMADIYGTVCSLVILYVKLVMSQYEMTGALMGFMKGAIFILSIFMYVFGMGFALIDLLRKKHKTEICLREKYMSLLSTYNGEKTQMFEDLRSMKHDINAHFRALNSYSKAKDYEKLDDYIKEMNTHYKWMNFKTFNTGNQFVDAVLAAGIWQEEDIRLVCEGVFPENIVLSDYALTVIFENLLKNAVEACKKLNYSKKQIRVKISDDVYGWGVEFINPIEWELDVSKMGESYTSKEDSENHGCGLYNVKKIVNEYDGFFDAEINKDEILVKVVIYY